MSGLSAVDLVVMEPVEAYALRGILEYIGLRVNWLPIARPQHLVDVLSAKESHAPHLILCCHGDERGIVLDELDLEIAREEPFTERLTPELARRYVRLPGRVVIATGCRTGSPDMAHAFVDGGCGAYIAPDGYPHEALFFVHCLYRELVRGAPLSVAVERARDHDDDAHMFRLYLPKPG
jgi:hypothetical protein